MNLRNQQEDNTILELREYIRGNFSLDVEIFEEMIKEMYSEGNKKYFDNNLMIPNPFEDAIRYRFILLVEVFKRFSQALSRTYFKYDYVNKNNTGHKNKHRYQYEAMNKYLLENKKLVKKITQAINDRDKLAHIWVEPYLDATDLKPRARLELVKFLYYALNVYVDFIDQKELSNEKTKIKLKVKV